MSLITLAQTLRMSTYCPNSPAAQSPRSEDSLTCADAAFEAYQQGLLNPHYFDDGWKQTVTHEKIPGLIRKGFTLQRAENGQSYLTRGLRGGAPKEFSSTQALAEELKKTDLKNPDYAGMQQLALNVINLFAQNQTKTKPLIEEVTALAFANNTVITKALLKVLVKEINQGELLDVDLLKALKTTLVNSLIDALDPDDLINVLQITIRRITQIHQQDKTNYKLYAGLSTISDILDVMGDANVIRVGRINLHDPLYKILDTLSDDDDTLIAAQATYAKQSLVRVPNDESKFRSVLRRGISLGQGVASLCKVVTDKDLSSLLDAYDNFKQAIEFQEKKKQWYGDVRILKLIGEKRNYDLFTKVIDTRLNDTSNPHIVANILFILQDVAHHDPELNARKWALDRMADLFLNDSKWGDKKPIKKSILAQLMNCAALPDQATASYAKGVLGSIGDRKNLTKLQGRLIEDVLEDLPQVTSKAVHHVDTPSTALITAVKQTKVVSIAEKIEKMKEQALKNEDVLKDLASYIPVLGSRCLFDPKEQTFDLDQAVMAFLKTDCKVFLLLGDSGGGKSTYLRFLENHLWKDWKPGKPIPLFISLPALRSPFKDAINEALSELGFTEAEQKELKSQHSFVFLLDGYDELKQKKNLYVTNQLNQWKAQTIITCRTQYLSGEQSSYQNYFAPPADNLISKASIDEASTSPFTQKQIENYCRKFIEIHKIPRTWEQYKADIASIPDLADLIETPFLLRIIAEVLPAIIEKHRHSKSQEQLKLLRIEIFDAFVNNWFSREELKIHQRDIEHNIPDIKEAFADLATRLALEMVQDGIVSVDYKESSSLFEQTPSKWAKYFNTDPKVTLVRSGVPLRKLGPHSYAFIHKSLLEYFSARAICSIQPQQAKVEGSKAATATKLLASSSSSSSSSAAIHPTVLPQSQNPPTASSSSSAISFDNLNKKILSQEPEIIHLLAECVTKDPSLTTQLFEFIERSKHDPQAATAASNAATILNAANVNLSGRNFKGIRIPEADLSHAIMTNTDLSYANLRNVKLNEAILDYSTIAFSETAGLEFGQRPFTQVPLPSYIQKIAVSPDGLWALFEGEDDKSVRLWDCQNSKELQGICLNFFYGELAISTDGKWALFGCSDKYGETGDEITVRLWDCQNGKELQRFSGHTRNVNSVAFSLDGKWALSGGADETVRLWDCQTGKELQCFRGHTEPVNKVAFSPDGKSVLSESKDGTVRLWDCQNGKELQCFSGHRYGVTSLAFSPDGKSILSGSGDGTVRLWDCQTGKELQSFLGHRYEVSSTAFSPDGKWALSGSGDRTVRLWDCQNGKELQCFCGHNNVVLNVAFSPDGKWARSIDREGITRNWDLTRISNHLTKNAQPYLTDLSISPDGNRALSGDADETVRLWDCQTGKELHSFFAHSGVIRSVAFSPNGKWILSGGDDCTVRLWDCQTGKKLQLFRGREATALSVAFSPDGKSVLSGDGCGTVRLWDCQSGVELLSFERSIGRVPISLTFSPDGKSILSGGYGSDGKAVQLIDCRTGEVLQSFQGHPYEAYSVAFSPNGKWVLSSGDDHTVRLWDCQTGKELYSFLGHSEKINSVAFSPDGNWALSGSDDKTVRLWDCQTGKELYRHILGFNIYNAKFLPDGKEILVSTSQFALQRWQLFDEQGCFRPILKWSTASSVLSAQNLCIEGVKDLSESNNRLLLQHGAIGVEENK